MKEGQQVEHEQPKHKHGNLVVDALVQDLGMVSGQRSTAAVDMHHYSHHT